MVNRPLNIGHFITQFPYQENGTIKQVDGYEYGGAELVAYNLASGLANRGHKIKVFTTSASKDSVEKNGSLEIYRYAATFRHKKGAFSLGMFHEPLHYDLDVVHAHFCTPAAEFAALRYARKHNVPFILHYHGDWVGVGGVARRVAISFYNSCLLNNVLSQAKAIISPSAYYIGESRFLSRHRDKIAVVPNGVALNDFQLPYSKEECRQKVGLPADGLIVLFMGNFFPYKSPDIIIRAMPEILSQVPAARLVMCGRGEMEEELRERARGLGVQERVYFPGFVSGELKSVYYKAADVFVLPSGMTTEVFPLVLLEASASGLPMVVSNLQTFRCIIEDGNNGFVAKRGDSLSFARSTLRLLTDTSLRGQMGENAKKKAQDYSWDKIAEQMEKVYEAVIENLPGK